MTDTQIVEFTPSQALATEFPEFSKITIYGTQDDPLFPVQQVEKALGVDRIRLDRGVYELGEDYIKVTVTAADGKSREQNLITEAGLYHVMGRNNTPVCKKFRRFTKVVMRELRLRGEVTTETAVAELKKYEAELADMRRMLANREQQLEETHEKLVQCEREKEKFYHQKMDLQTKILATQVELESRTDNYSAEYQLERVKEKTMKKLYVYMVSPPKAIAGEFPDYDMELEPTMDDEICFEVSFRTRAQDACAEFYVYREISADRLHQKLHDRDFSIVIGEKEHKTMFCGTLDRLRYVIDELI